MANTTIDRHVDDTVKILITLMAEPRLKAHELAKMLDRTPNYIARMLARFREAGLEIDYDWTTNAYTGKFSTKLEKSILGEYARKLKRAVAESEQAKPPVQFVSKLHRYTLQEFADQFGSTSQNVYNMIIGYKGQKLPIGWCAYQLKERSKWYLQKMETDRSGKKFVVPDIVKDAFDYKVGDGKPSDLEGNEDRKDPCVVPDCGDQVLAKGLCNTHYYQARRHPERFAKYQQKAARKTS